MWRIILYSLSKYMMTFFTRKKQTKMATVMNEERPSKINLTYNRYNG